MKKIKILMLHLNYGGIEKQTISMANQLCDKFDIEIISVYNFKTPPAYQINKKIKIKYLMDKTPNKEEILKNFKKFKLTNLIKSLFLATNILFEKRKALKECINNLETDILFSTRINFSKVIDDNYEGKGLIIFQEHNYINTKKYGKKVKNSTKKTDYIIVMSEYAKKTYKKWVPNKKIMIIPNISDYDIQKDKELSNLNNNTLIAIGRLEKIKRYEDVIKAFDLIQKEHKDIKLKIVGDGSQKVKLLKLVEKLKLEQKIEFTGLASSKTIKEYLKKSDLLIITSHSEAFPMVIIEAGGIGVPVISYEIPAGPISMIEDKNFLVENGNIKELSKKISNYLNLNNNEKREIGEKVWSNSLRYSPQKIIPLWINLLEGEKNENK